MFDTANPFEAVMVDTLITSAVKNKPAAENLVRFMDGRKNLLQPERLTVAQSVYLNTQNSVIFKPSELNMVSTSFCGEKSKLCMISGGTRLRHRVTSKRINANLKNIGPALSLVMLHFLGA